MAENRLVGSYPVIGIRPCIDGRRGPLRVRENLEEFVESSPDIKENK